MPLNQTCENAAIPVCYSNPYAPPWRLPNFEAPKVNLRWTYSPNFVVGAGTTVYNQLVLINGGADMLVRELAFDIGTANNWQILIRFRDGQGKRLMLDLVTAGELTGPIPINLLLPKGTYLYVDIQNQGVGSTNVQVILKGIQIWEPMGINTCMPGFEPEGYTALYDMYSRPPKGWHDEPFQYYFEFQQNASSTLQGLPLSMDTDATFYWRGITGEAAGSGKVQIQFSDAWNNLLSDNPNYQDNEFGVAPQPRPIFAEVVCPARSVLTVEAMIEYLGQNAFTKFALIGVKRFQD